MEKSEKVREVLNEILTNQVYFIGERDFGTWQNGKINERIKDFVEFFLEKYNPQSFQELKIEVKAMNKQGIQKEYEIKAHFVTDKDAYHTKKTGWNAYNTFREALEAIENQVFGKNE